MGVQPRVFVSSVVEGFQAFRDAARHGIVDAGGQPVLVNEDFPALPISPRNACLDGVESADIYLCIIGSRAGSKAPSGKLITEEEYEHARTLRRPALVFGIEGPREADAEAFLERLSRYVTGQYRVMVADAPGLRRSIAAALQPLVRSLSLPLSDPRIVAEALTGAAPHSQEVVLRLVIAPERDDEVIDPMAMDEPEFLRVVQEIGHSRAVQLMDYAHAKQQRVDRNEVIVEQDARSGHRHATRYVFLRVTSSGLMVIDQNVSQRSESSGGFLDSMVVATEALEAAANRAFAFCQAFFEAHDPYERHQGFMYNAVLWGLGHRTVSRSPQPRSSYPMRMMGGESPIVAFDRARGISRSQLRDATDEAERIARLLERQASS